MRIIITWLANTLLSVGKKSLRSVPVTLLNPTTPYAQIFKTVTFKLLVFSYKNFDWNWWCETRLYGDQASHALSA